ncbi:MAG: UDP-galactopyranose mutase [Hyphomicrobiaceae bacterium]|nr:UDP-galactopyranose mutase [Hyphomicrobiaceae bacterium]
MTILVVGAGFAGAVYARQLAEAGYRVHVIDMKEHVAGHCHDYMHASGVRVHRYGPHVFHTSNAKVVGWLSRFTDWVPHEHCVVALLGDGRYVPLPINIDTVNAMFGVDLKTAEDLSGFLKSVSETRNPIVTAEDQLYKFIGRRLTDHFYRPYMRKMYQRDLTEIPASVVRRISVRGDSEKRYFPGDAFQALPKDGYTAMFERILGHPRIEVRLGMRFEHAMLSSYEHCFNSMPIDEFFSYRFGELPYRSNRFHTTVVPAAAAPRHAVIDYTDEGAFVREIWWHNLPGHHVAPGPSVVRTVEEPCDYRDNGMERHYPLRLHDGEADAVYERYRRLAAGIASVTFIGRCGTYQYLDMHQVVNQSLAHVGKWCASRSEARQLAALGAKA